MRKKGDIIPIRVGSAHAVFPGAVQAVLGPDIAQDKKLLNKAQEQGLLVDACRPRKVRSILILQTGHLLLSSVQAETLIARLTKSAKRENHFLDSEADD